MEPLWQQRARADAVIVPVFKSAMAGLLTPAEHYPDLALPMPRWIADLPGNIFGVKVHAYDLVPWAHPNDIIVVWFGMRAAMRQHCRHSDLTYIVDTFGDERIGHAVWAGGALTLNHPRGIGKPVQLTDDMISRLGLVVAIQRGWLPDSPNVFLQYDFDLAQVDPRIPRGD